MAQLLRLSRGATAGSARLPCPLFPTRRPRRSAIFMAAPLRGKGPRCWDVPQQRQTGLHRSTSRQNQRATSTGFVSPSSSHGQPHLPTFPAEVGRWLLSLEGLRGLLADIDGENQAPNNQDIDGGKNATSTTHLTPTQRAEQALSAVQKLLETVVCQSPWLIHPNNNGRHTVATRTEVKKRRAAVMPLAVSQPPSDADSALVERCTDALALLRTEVINYVWRVKASTCMPMEQITDDFHWPKEAEVHILTYTHLMPSLAALPGSRINLESEVSLRHMIVFSHAATDQPMSVAVARDADRYLSMTAGSDSKLESSLPWLVARLSQPLEQRQPGTASAGVVTEDEWLRWMTAAADALCAATPESILRRGWMTEADNERSSSPSSSSPFAVLMPVLCEDEEVPVTRIDRTGTGQAASSTEAADLWLRERTGGCLDTHSCAVQPFWLLVLEELRAWWWESLEHLSAAKAHTLKSSLKSRSKKQSPTSSLEFRAVGALLSFRRMVSAMGTKNLLGPIFVLHNLIMGSPNGSESECTAHRWMTRVMEGHFGSLLLREGMLLQAAMLSSMGHSCERSVDLPRGASASSSPLVADLLRQLSTLQQRCVALVGLLSQQIERSLSDEMVSSVLRQALSGLTPRTAENARAKLQEGLRLSVKLSLRCGDTHSVCSLHAACQSMGGSWEVGRALLHEGHPTEAVEAFRAFFDQTARQFPHTLPPSIRRQALAALSAAALERTVTGAHPHAEVVTTADLMDAARHASKTLGRLVEQGYGPLPRAVRLDAILHFIFSVEVLQREDINHAIATYLAGCMTVHEYCLTYAATEGLDVKVAEKLVEGFLCLRQRSSMSLSQANIPNAVLNQCFTLTVTTMMLHYPYIPVCRVVLTRLLRAGAHDAVLETLRLLAGGHMTGTYVRALLRSLPLIALQGLESVASGLQSTTINEDGGKVDVARAVELQELRDGLQMALRSRTEVETQKQPWACPLCSTWNNRFAHSCKLCGSRSLAVIQCQRCHGFGSTEHQSCPICEAPWWKHPEGDDASRSLSLRGSNGGEALLLDREKVLAVLPMRRWTCTPCRHDNTAENLFYCAACSAPSPTAAACQLHEVQCKECGARCPKGMLRPWCSCCGCLFGDVAASAGKRARLWWCLSCHRMNPWLLSHCDGCDNPRWYSSMSTLSSDDADGGVPGDSTADYRTVLQPVVEVPWRTMRCLKCRQHNPLGSCVCRSCGHPLAALPQDVRGRVEGALITWRAGVLRREKESIAGVEMAWHSMSTQHVGGDSPPTQTKLEQTPASLWVCLHGGCLHVNQTPQTTTDDPLACSACGHFCSADSVAVMTQHNPVVPEFLLRHGSQATPSAVLLSMDAGDLELCEDATQRTRCPHCGSSYPPDGVEAFSACAGCGSLSQRCAPQSVLASSAGSERGSDGFNILRSILVLNTMQRSLTLHASTAGGGASSQSPTWLLTHVTTGIEVLASLPPHCVPWKAAKLQHPHSAVEQIQMLLRGIQTVASLGAPSSLNEAASLHGDEQEKQWLSHVRPWALAGLGLVELVNATTEMDVMGFDALAHLCLLIRPWAREEIYSHTRRTYLLRRRLSREAIAGGLLCPTCLHAHSLDDPCPH